MLSVGELGKTAMGSQRLDGNISNQATNFLNDIVANANENTCAQFTNHEYEVCTAYIFNSIFADLVPYYKFAMSDNASLARLVSFHLDSRFTGQANQLVRQRVAGWPSGEKDVDVPVIKILSVNASLADNSATLRTQETWLVTDQSEHVVFQETDAFHTITLSRVQSYVLHKWVVTDIE